MAEGQEVGLTAEGRANMAYQAWRDTSMGADNLTRIIAQALTEAEERGYARGNLNNATLMEATLVGRENAMSTMRPMIEQAKFDAYEKARELVGYSASACHVIEAQMQEEFPDRAFVPYTQARAGSRMDGSNLRMPKTPNQLRDEGRQTSRADLEAAIKALLEIRDRYGKVCENYEVCDCRSCESSYGSWAVASQALVQIGKEKANVEQRP